VLLFNTPPWALVPVASRARCLVATDAVDVVRGLPAGAFSLLVLGGARGLLHTVRPLASPAAIFALFEIRDGARPNVAGFGPFKSVACDGGLLTLWRAVPEPG
jgi:hypothetical protein